MPIYSLALHNYTLVNRFPQLDPGGPRENLGLSHMPKTGLELLTDHTLPAGIPKPGSSVSLNPQPLPPEPPPQSLWNTSAVLFGGASQVGVFPPGYHGPTPDPAPWTAVGAWLR